MALPPIPLNSSYSASSIHYPHFLLLQPSCNAKFLKFKVSCSNQSVQVDTQHPQPVKATLEESKKKRNPRPSFFEQIRDKWSVRLISEREKFPWEEPEEKQKPGQQPEEEDERVERSSVAYSSEPNSDLKAFTSHTESFRFRNRCPPWHQPLKPANLNLENGEPLLQYGDEFISGNEDKVTDDVIERQEIVEDVRAAGKVGRKLNIRNPVSVMRSKETKASSRKGKGASLNEKPASDGGGYSNSTTFTEGNGNAGNLPSWERVNRMEGRDIVSRTRSNTGLAEKLLPEHVLRRLRNVALRMVERFDVGNAGITQELVDSIHEKWRKDEVVKLKFEGPLKVNMKRAHETLESKTGGLVIWRSGGSVVLYRGMAYNLPSVQSYTKLNHADVNTVQGSVDAGSDVQGLTKEPVRTGDPIVPDSKKYLKHLSEKELRELSDLDHLLDELGPRFKDWSGREPIPVDADLLPAVIPGYKTPFRLLPYGVKASLSDKEMTLFRRLARSTSPHFALGRNRDLQGLAKAMVKLWEKSAIAKIAIKRGVLNTRNERMAEELKNLTGGTLLSRNKEYIVFYRGNDFLPPGITEVLTGRQELALQQHDKEEQARQIASSITRLNEKSSQVPLLAGTLAETREATTHWGQQPSSQEVEKMRRESTLNRLESLIRNLEKNLVLAKAKVKKAERALAKLQSDLEPADLPTDLETLTSEERFLFRKIGLSMKPYLLLGRRVVYSGTIENMHLHWKYRELVKIIVKGKNAAQVKHIAISLEAESGGVLVSVDKTTKGYVIIVYRGKNYERPLALKPKNLLTKRQALARSIELQRREALKHHIIDLEERIELLKSELEDMKNGKIVDVDTTLYSDLSDPNLSDDELKELNSQMFLMHKYKMPVMSKNEIMHRDDSGSDEKNQSNLLE